MSLVESVATILAEATCDKPMFLHIDAIGLLHFGENIGNDLEEIIKNKLVSFSKALVLAESYGANVIIPSFSYSLAERDIYNVSNSQSKVGAATEFLRKINNELDCNIELSLTDEDNYAIANVIIYENKKTK